MGSLYPATPGPFVMSCDMLEGDNVVNGAGEDLGTLEHIVLDIPNGRIAYAVVAHGGVFGIGERLFAIPWSAFTFDADRQCFVLHVDRSRLERAPAFDRDHWPSMADTDWARHIHDYYDVRPYWQGPRSLQ